MTVPRLTDPRPVPRLPDLRGRSVMLSLCDRTAAMCEPWVRAGHVAIALDIQHADPETGQPWVTHQRAETEDGPRGHLFRVGGDVLTWLPPLADYVFVASFPPCTHLAGSGARWWEGKERDALAELYPLATNREIDAMIEAGETPVFDAAMELLERCREIGRWSGAPWMLENPVGRITQRWPAPRHRFDPYEYGGYEGGEDDGYTKRTCLWTSRSFVMPPHKPIELDPDTHDRIHKAAPSPERTDIRSVTPRGFAQAVFEHNAPDL